MRPQTILPAVFLSVLIASCASPAQRIERALVNSGVPPSQAQCMGYRLAERLTTSQLRQLDQLARLTNDRLGRARLEDIGRAIAGPENPALIAEVVRTGIVCLL